jgi:AraC-like DNA-binding protein
MDVGSPLALRDNLFASWDTSSPGEPMEIGKLTRSATLTGYESLASSLGLDPVGMVQGAGLAPQVLRESDLLVSLDSVATLLETSSQRSGQEAFGLLLAEQRRFSNLGLLAMVLREEPTPRAALQALARYMQVQNRGLHLRLEDDERLVVVHLELQLLGHRVSRQGIEMAAAITLQTMREVSGGRTRPVRVCFVHERPHSLEVHRRVLGTAVDFSQPFNAVVYRGNDLDVPVPLADPVLGKSLKRWLDVQLSPEDGDPLEDVRLIIRRLLPTGSCSVDQVARQLGMHRRTLNRRLAHVGESVSTMIDGVRAEMADSYMADGGRTLYEVAGLLGFASGAEFSRWFRGRFGMTPTQWLTHREEAQADAHRP